MVKVISPARTISVGDIDDVTVDFNYRLSTSETLSSSGLSVTAAGSYITITGESVNSALVVINNPEVTVPIGKAVVFTITGSSVGNEVLIINVNTSDGRKFVRKIEISVV